DFRIQRIDATGSDAHQHLAWAGSAAPETVLLKLAARLLYDPTFVACGTWFGHFRLLLVREKRSAVYVLILLIVRRARNWPPLLNHSQDPESGHRSGEMF